MIRPSKTPSKRQNNVLEPSKYPRINSPIESKKSLRKRGFTREHQERKGKDSHSLARLTHSYRKRREEELPRGSER
jgi:hypothetical protein